MAINVLKFIYMYIAYIICSADSKRPGLEIVIAEKGLNTAGGIVVKNMAAKLKGDRIKDIHGEARVSIGNVKYDITSIIVQSFTTPTSKVSITDTFGITWGIYNAGLTVGADWKYKYKLGFISISDHGSLVVSCSGISVSVSAKMGVDNTGRPTIYTTACTSHIDHLRVKFHGGASWLYNLFSNNIANKLKEDFIHDICKAARDAIDTDSEHKLAELQVILPIGKDMVLDYSLSQAPVFQKGVLKTMHKAEVTWPHDPKPFPSEATAFPEITKSDRALYIIVSDYMVNSYMYQAYTHGLVKYTLTPDSLPKGKGGILNTTCTTFGTTCIGNFLHKVAVLYPYSSILIDMATTEAPTIRVTPNGINATASGLMTFNVKTPKNDIVYLFKTSVTVTMSVNAWLDNHIIKCNVKAFRPTVKVIDSDVGGISDANLQFIFTVASRNFIIVKLNELCQKGVDIPNLKGATFAYPKLVLNHGSVTFGIDVYVGDNVK